MDLDYWKMILGDYVVALSEDEVNKLIEQFKNGDELLQFTDMFGSVTHVPRAEFKGVWHTDYGIRTRTTEFNDALKEEEKESKKWD